MRKLFFIAAAVVISIISISFYGCKWGNKANEKNSIRVAKGGVKYGGVFRVNETEYFRSLFPHNITEVVGHRIAAQIYEGLVSLNQKDLSIEPALAESWQVNDSATRFTFKIRKGVFFHNHELLNNNRKEITAWDIAYCLEKLCIKSVNNQGFWVFSGIVQGADTYYVNPSSDNRKNLGIKALNDSTLEITLSKPFAGFLYRLAMPFCAVFPKEMVDNNPANSIQGVAIGTGPFMLKKVVPDDAVYLVRNPDYWKKDSFGNALPYLDGIKISFIKEEKTEMLDFRQGNLEMKYRLPMDAVDEIIDRNGNLKEAYKKFQLQTATELSLSYYGFLHTHPLFSNVHVRRAFCYAVDRQKLVDYTLKGEALPAIYGIVPPGMAGYQNSRIQGFKYNPVKAQEELKKAGFENGKGFPAITLQINSGGGRNEKVAEAVTAMLKENLNIRVEITQLPFAQHLENYESGKVAFWRAGWVADYPDPENFLSLCYGKYVPANPNERAYLNAFRYQNPEFDKWFEEARIVTDINERNRLYEKLDQLVIDDAVLLPLFYTINRRMLQPYVKNFPINGMEYRNFSEVWLDK
ncbi:MAG: ABC transporter substrate-binding protein [Chitinophagales bacterium]|nr:ABC transporter substrate-binding protein [Chitinophagales bacterium]MDW8274468.1 ABC transporter substrate-binding protein [Chitinophagales bacterium]